LRINAWAQFRVADIEKAVLQNAAYDKQLYILLQLALRSVVATLGFDELLEKRERLSDMMLDQLREHATALGVEIANFGIRDIILSGEVRAIMNEVLVADKKAQANAIMRREETAATRSLLNTAKLMEDNSMLWKLKEMEFVERIAEKIQTITLNGNGQIADQLKQLFIAAGN
jgi:regulator of protease activity HflC (stomatin/prohibitin superfamily)